MFRQFEPRIKTRLIGGARRALPVDIRGPVRGRQPTSSLPAPTRPYQRHFSPNVSVKGDGFQPTTFIHQHFIPLSSPRNNSLLFIVRTALTKTLNKPDLHEVARRRASQLSEGDSPTEAGKEVVDLWRCRMSELAGDTAPTIRIEPVAKLSGVQLGAIGTR